MTDEDPGALLRAAADAAAAAQTAGVTIRDLVDAAEITTATQLLGRIWKVEEGRSIVEPGLLVALAHTHNYVAAAFRDDEMIGVGVGFFHQPAQRSLHSHIAGVVAGSAGGGVGFALKSAQRVWALEHGADTITWTFDPLVARNAHFNLSRLGAVAVEYLPNLYGEMTDGINRGQPSDRMMVEWDLRSPRAAVVRDDLDVLPRPLTDADGSPRVDLAVLGSARACVLEIPRDIEELRQTRPEEAVRWRWALREALTALLAEGWTIAGFARPFGYVLDRG